MTRADAIIVGAGPAGCAAAIHLARARWRVILIEQHSYPRGKVCGECLSAGALTLLDDLGVGPQVRAAAGPELRHTGWMGRGAPLVAQMPRCAHGAHPFGRAVGRDILDTLLLEQARALGVEVVQPARVHSIRPVPGGSECEVVSHCGALRQREVVEARLIIDAHGSWERSPLFDNEAQEGERQRRRSDLFAFKARFENASLAEGHLPVLSFSGGYGGLVRSDHGHMVLAFCVRRDLLHACRGRAPGLNAAAAVEMYVRAQCPGLDAVMRAARRRDSWLAVGPLRTGEHVQSPAGVFKIGNAAGESHPLIGEGINMALQSAALLSGYLTGAADTREIGAPALAQLQKQYAKSWRRQFAPRLRRAAVFAHIAMRRGFATPAGELLKSRPGLVSFAARVAGKAQGPSSHFRAAGNAA